ncbi:MAG: penicillin-binding transpeptidase domain-containing protein [Anaerolineae bacterium]|nr:penicillin-binding transpeptidase domain-containing protein [Anaerolineae bacterium]
MRRLVVLPLLLLLAACGTSLPFLQDAYDPRTPTPLPTSTLAPTATPIAEAAEGVARAYYRAWEDLDYAGMYSLLSPQSQALVDEASFVALYEDVARTATLRSVQASPMAILQEGSRAQMNVEAVWDTLLVGTVARQHSVELAHNGGRWGIVWDESLILPEMEGGQQLYMDYRIPARANIYDAEGRALAYQGTAVTLGVVPGDITDEAGLLDVLASVFDRDPATIRGRYATALPNWRVPLGDVSAEVLQEHAAILQPYLDDGGLYTEQRTARIYPENGVAPHVVGYVGPLPAEEIDRYREEGYRGDEHVGRSGVEGWGESYLSGQRGGTLTIIGPTGEYISTVATSEPRQARSIYLTIDMDLQQAVEAALAEAVVTSPSSGAGSAVVLDVKTGNVLAVASYPTYNPGVFDVTRPSAESDLAALLNAPGNPLLNRAVQGAYPTGSLFKVITFSAGMNSGLYTPDTTYLSVGSWRRLGDNFIKRDWLSGGHGNVTMRRAIAVSCNTCFYDMGFNLNEYDPYFFPETARQYGLGAPTGIEGIHESAGLIPDPDWKMASGAGGWVPGDAVNMAIGQGDVQVTPLQMARVFAAFANGGTLLVPRLIDRVGAGGGAPEETWPVEESGQIPLSSEHLEALRGALREVATQSYGTASHRFIGLPVPVAGKTGTAEAPPNQPHSWFAGYAPAEPYTLPDGTVLTEPEIAVVVMIEHAGEGSTYAAPLFRRIVELYYNITPVTPFHWVQ